MTNTSLSIPLVSLVVPIYNMARYLPRCIDSILEQTFTNIQLILVNDASTDNSLTICRQYAERDSRITLINKPTNEGVDRARFSGINAAHGRYLFFPDPDDWLTTPSVLQTMVDKAEQTGADIVQIQRVKVINNHSFPRRIMPDFSMGLVQGDQLKQCWTALFGDNFLAGGMWAKLYRKEVIDRANLSPSGLLRSQDVVFNLQLGPHVHSIYFIPQPGYTYRWGYKREQYRAQRLHAAKQKFSLRLRVMADQHAYHAWDLPRLALLNNGLREEINQRIRFNREIPTWLTQELQDPIWQQATDLHSPLSSFAQAVRNRDHHAVHAIVRHNDRSYRIKCRLKASLYSLLSSI